MLKKIICSVLAVMLISTQAFALSGKMTGGFPDKSTFQHTADDYQAQCRAGYGHLPQGLTFYKDFTKIPAGTYSNAVMGNFLNADYSIGSSVATFTSTSGSFTITSNGYQSTTANDEVLKYLIAGNRTAEQETIVIKFTPTGDFANDGVARFLTDTETKSRWLTKLSAGTRINSRPNSTDNSGVQADTTTTPLNNVMYVVASTYQHSSPYISLYLNGSGQAPYTTGDFTTPAWGTNFYIGSSNVGTLQINGYIKYIICFNRKLSDGEISSVGNPL